MTASAHRKQRLIVAAATGACAAALLAAAPASADNDAIGYPEFAGSPDPCPPSRCATARAG